MLYHARWWTLVWRIINWLTTRVIAETERMVLLLLRLGRLC
jgi:hypothetical protein